MVGQLSTSMIIVSHRDISVLLSEIYYQVLGKAGSGFSGQSGGQLTP